MSTQTVCTSCGKVDIVSGEWSRQCERCNGAVKSHHMVTADEWARLDEIDAVYEYDGTRLCDVDPFEAQESLLASLPVGVAMPCDQCALSGIPACHSAKCEGFRRMDFQDVIFLRRDAE